MTVAILYKYKIDFLVSFQTAKIRNLINNDKPKNGKKCITFAAVLPCYDTAETDTRDMTDFFLTMGYAGLLFGSYALGWIIPGSTELLMAGCMGAGLSFIWVLVTATLGVTLNGITLYLLGRLSNMETACRKMHIKPERVTRYQDKIRRYGSWMALLTWIPYGGEAMCVALGLCHTKALPTILLMALGKGARCAVMLAVIVGIFQTL